MLAVCVDQSKAYDSIRLDLLAFLLAGNGMPPEVWRPMLDMAKAPRRLKVMSAVGEWRDTTLPSGHTDHVVPAGEVAAWSHHRDPGSHCPMLGRRQHGGKPRRDPRPRGLG